MSEGTNPLSYIKYAIYGIIGLFVIFNIFSDSDGEDYIEQTIEDPTQGIRVELKEMEQDLYKITDEEILEKREDSQIIVAFMDNTVDTFSIEEVTLEEANDPRRSVFRSVAMAGMFGYMMGRPMSSGVSRSAYANQASYNKSSTSGTSQLRSTASKRTVKTPSKGFGSGKSTRSYGG